MQFHEISCVWIFLSEPKTVFYALGVVLPRLEGKFYLTAYKMHSFSTYPINFGHLVFFPFFVLLSSFFSVFLFSSHLIHAFIASVIFWEKSPVDLMFFHYRLPHGFRILTHTCNIVRLKKNSYSYYFVH